MGEGQTGKMADSITALAVQVRSCPRVSDVWGWPHVSGTRPLPRTAGGSGAANKPGRLSSAWRLSPAFCLHYSSFSLPQVPADARRSVLVDLLTVYGEGGKAIVFTQVGAGAMPAAGAGCWLLVVLRLAGAARPLCSRRWVQARWVQAPHARGCTMAPQQLRKPRPLQVCHKGVDPHTHAALNPKHSCLPAADQARGGRGGGLGGRPPALRRTAR